MAERDLWAAVAEAAISEHAKRIAAARKGRGLALFDAGNTRRLVGSVDEEVKAARQYFESRDWREVAALAGLNIGADDIMSVIENGWRPYRVSHRVTPIQQGAA